jgi:hypothetical protein
MSKELNTVAPKKWVANFAGAAPTLDVSDGIIRADIAIDSSTTPNKIWRCLDATEGAPIWHEIDFRNPTGFGTSVPLDLVHLKGSDTTPDAADITHNNLYLESPASGDTGVWIGDTVSGPTWYMQNYRDEKSEFWYLFNQRSGQNPIVCNTGGRIGFNNPTNILDYHSWYLNPATGALNDMDVGGIYTAKQGAIYDIVIATTGSPNAFKWRRSDDQGFTWTAYSSNIAITGEAQTIERGVTATFSNLTGHNTNDEWYFPAHSQLPPSTHTVHPSMIDEINYTPNYTLETPVWTDVTMNSNWTRAADVEMPPTGTTSAIYVGCRSDYNSLLMIITSAAAGATLQVQYYNGSGWTTLTNATHSFIDGTANLTKTGNITWNKTSMADWAKWQRTGESGEQYLLYWVRIISTTNITAAPSVSAIARHGALRLGIYTSHFDTIPAFSVDALGRISQGTDMVTGDNQLQIVYPQNVRPSLTTNTSIVEFDSQDSTRSELALRLSQSTATGLPTFSVSKSRGTLETPSNLVANDYIGQMGFNGYVNGGWRALAGMRGVYTGDGTTRYANLLFGVNNNDTYPVACLKISCNSATGNGQLQMMNDTTPVGVAIEEFSIDGTLAGNSDLAVPTEKAVKTYVDSMKIYGEMFQTNNATATTINSTAWFKVLNYSTGLVNGVTYGTSDLTVLTAGTYLVSAFADVTLGNNADILEFAVAVGGTPQTKSTSSTKTNSTNVRGQINSQCIVTLSANAVITLMVRNTAANRNTTVVNSSVTLHRIA